MIPIRWCAVVVLLPLAAACGGGSPDAAPTVEAVTQKSSPPQAAAPSPESVPEDTAIRKMKAKLLAEPSVVDLVYDPLAAVQWQIGVKDDGSLRHGLAEYVCMELADAGLVSSKTSVRIVDVDRLARSGGDFRDASLGRVTCLTGAWSNI